MGLGGAPILVALSQPFPPKWSLSAESTLIGLRLESYFVDPKFHACAVQGPPPSDILEIHLLDSHLSRALA